MNIEIHGETEARIQKELDSGRYATPEEVVVAAIAHWKSSTLSGHVPSSTRNIEDIIREQGVRPIGSGAALRGPGGREDETADEMVSEIEELRRSLSGHRQ